MFGNHQFCFLYGTYYDPSYGAEYTGQADFDANYLDGFASTDANGNLLFRKNDPNQTEVWFQWQSYLPPQMLTVPRLSPGQGQGIAATLTAAEITPVAHEAEERWFAAGINPALRVVLDSIQFTPATLPGSIVAETAGTNILVDATGAGYGWFLDGMRASDDDFPIAETESDLLAKAGSPAYGRVDLLTVLEHEIGHILGLGDTTSPDGKNDIMYLWLSLGERRLVSAADAIEANAASQLTTFELAAPGHTPKGFESRLADNVGVSVSFPAVDTVAGVNPAEAAVAAGFFQYVSAMDRLWIAIGGNVAPALDEALLASDPLRPGRQARV